MPASPMELETPFESRIWTPAGQSPQPVPIKSGLAPTEPPGQPEVAARVLLADCVFSVF